MVSWPWLLRMSVSTVSSIALCLAVAAALPTSARAGVACQLAVSTDGGPASSGVEAVVGKNVHFEGSFFSADAEVSFSFLHPDDLEQTLTATADSAGDVTLDGSFEPSDVGYWTVEADDGSCQAQVWVLVVPDGPYTSVEARTYLCPLEIQNDQDLAANPDACDIAVLPADDPTPPGYTFPNLQTLDFGYALHGSDGSQRDISDTELNGGGVCDPATLTCAGGWGYVWSQVILGETRLVGSGFTKYRLGAVKITDGTTEVQPTALNSTGGSVTWDLQADSAVTVSLYWFFGTSSPSPTASPPSGTPAPTGDSLPNTMTTPGSGADALAVTFLVVLWLIGLGLMVAWSRARRGMPDGF